MDTKVRNCNISEYQAGLRHTREASTLEVGQRGITGPHVHHHGSRSPKTMTVNHREVGGGQMRVHRRSECGSPAEVLTGRGWEGQEGRESEAGPGIVPRGGGISSSLVGIIAPP